MILKRIVGKSKNACVTALVGLLALGCSCDRRSKAAGISQEAKPRAGMSVDTADYADLPEDPHERMLQLERRIDNIFAEIWNEPFTSFGFQFPSRTMPRRIVDRRDEVDAKSDIDYKVEDGKLIVSVLVPVADEKELDIRIDADGLTVKSARRETAETDKDGLKLKSEKSQQYYRHLSLPGNARYDRAEKQFADGRLTVTVPLAEKPAGDPPARPEKNVRDMLGDVTDFGPLVHSPFKRMRQLEGRMNRIFEEMWLEPFTTFGFEFPSMKYPEALDDIRKDHDTKSSLDYSVRDNVIVVKATVPAKNENEIKVEITKRGITIRSTIEETSETSENGVVERTARSQQFYRHLALPDNADIRQARQEFSDGELTITIPLKTTEPKLAPEEKLEDA